MPVAAHEETFEASDVIQYLDPFLQMASNHYHDDSRLNGRIIQPNDLHTIRQWRNKKTKYATITALDRILSNYDLHISDFDLWIEEREHNGERVSSDS